MKVTDAQLELERQKELKDFEMKTLPGSSTDRPNVQQILSTCIKDMEKKTLPLTSPPRPKMKIRVVTREAAFVTPRHLEVVSTGLPPEPIYVPPTREDLPHN